MGTPRAGVLVLLLGLCAGCGRGYEYAPIDPVPTVLKDPPPPVPGHDAMSAPTEGIDVLPPAMELPTTPAAATDESHSGRQESAPPR